MPFFLLKNQICFLENSSYLAFALKKTKASAIFLPNDENIKHQANQINISWASFNHPKLAFAEALEIIYPKSNPKKVIHPTAVIGENVEL